MVETEILTLPVDCISPDLGQPRKYFDRIEELAKDIKANGLLNLICVHAVGNNKYRIIHGERRFRAILSLGWTEVKCEAKTGLTEAQIRGIQLAENLERSNLTSIELGREFDRRLKENPDLKVEDLAESIHRSRAYVWVRLSLLRLSPKIQQKILERKIDMTRALQLLHVPDLAERERLAESLAPDLSSRKLEARLRDSGFLKREGPNGRVVMRVTNRNSSSDDVAVKDLSIYPLLTGSERVKWTDLMMAFAQDLHLRGSGH